jgi:cation diffusion facilitator family transporter
MHAESMEGWTHDHVFLGADHARNERRTRIVIALCCTMMVAEIVGGILFRSMALVADGLHMSTHAAALLIAAAAYAFARRRANDRRFTFGTGKFGDLAGFTSAIVLALIALLIAWESVARLIHPVPIAFNEAIPIAALGLGVNLLSAWLLRDEHEHDHNHHGHGHEHRHSRDLNLRAAYVHVLADAAVSILAVIGLVIARELQWLWIDAAMGIIGATVISNWALALMRAASAVLLDIRPNAALVGSVRECLEQGSDRIADLHLWRVGPGHNAVVATIVSHEPQAPSFYKERLANLPGLSHVTIEVERCA